MARLISSLMESDDSASPLLTLELVIFDFRFELLLGDSSDEEACKMLEMKALFCQILFLDMNYEQ